MLDQLLASPFDPKQLQNIVSSSDKTIALSAAYQVLFSPDHTKFVAFFAETVPAGKGKAFQDSHDDRNVNIVSDNQMGFFSGELPNTYAHIVRGVFHEGKWYYEKSDVTYFDAATPAEARITYFNYLQKWGFFLEGAAASDPAFWEGSETTGYTMTTKVMFAKVPQGMKNAGMYRVVADQQKD